MTSTAQRYVGRGGAKNSAPSVSVTRIGTAAMLAALDRWERSRDIREYKLTPYEQRVMDRLIESMCRFVSIGDLIEATYPAPDDEPEDAKNCIRQYVDGIRHKGIPIEVRWGWGHYRYNGVSA